MSGQRIELECEGREGGGHARGLSFCGGTTTHQLVALPSPNKRQSNRKLSPFFHEHPQKTMGLILGRVSGFRVFVPV